MEVKNKKWLKYIGQSAVVLHFWWDLSWVFIRHSKDQKQNRSQDLAEDTKLNIAVVNEDKAVKLNDKEYNLGG